ncbi:MAG: tRNA dihydrouridine synthase [Candidatus Roizmanbacteria bacterium]
MANFWQNLPVPFLVLAPMDDVTDVVCREVIARTARPDVFFTEFTNADALFSRGRDAVIRKLKFTKNQHPIVAQIWGKGAENMGKAAELVKELGFDGVDINMGCPVPAVMKKGAGAGHIGDYNRSKEIIQAVREGSKGISFSIKTRLGQEENIAREWGTFLLQQKLDALIVHGRTASQMSRGEADWQEIGKIVEIRNEICPETVVIGNGDIKSYAQALDMHKKYKVDGVMIGRGIFSNPWIFEKKENAVPRSTQDFIDVFINHIQLFEETWGDTKNFELMKKFVKMYIQEFPGAHNLRTKLMECKKANEMTEILRGYKLLT